MPKTPVALFTYNRPEHTCNMLASLAACVRLDECEIFIYSDAPRLPEYAQKVAEVRALVREWGGGRGAHIIEHDENLGLSHSIVAGANDMCAEYGRVIVLEDDLILHPAFINFMLQSLDRYAGEERLAQIAGFTFPIKTSLKPDAFFLPLTTSWGWATWERSWKSFSWDLQDAIETLSADPALRYRFDLNGAYPYYEMLLKTMDGALDSWAVRWYWYNFVQDKLTLYPRQSLVWQNGFDKYATHTRLGRSKLQNPIDDFMNVAWDQNLVFPSIMTVDEALLKELRFFLKKINSPSRSSQIRAWIDKEIKMCLGGKE
jgi:hypothetical protein